MGGTCATRISASQVAQVFFCPDLALKSKLAFVPGHLCAWGDEEFHWAVSVIKNGIAIVTIWAKPA
jgi:hypothetical protein